MLLDAFVVLCFFLKFSNDFVRAFLIRNPRVWVGGVIDEGDGREINIQREERKMRVPSVLF